MGGRVLHATSPIIGDFRQYHTLLPTHGPRVAMVMFHAAEELPAEALLRRAELPEPARGESRGVRGPVSADKVRQMQRREWEQMAEGAREGKPALDRMGRQFRRLNKELEGEAAEREGTSFPLTHV